MDAARGQLLIMNDLTLGQKQRLFARLIAELIVWIYGQEKHGNNFSITLADGSIDNPRRFRIGETVSVAQDAVHRFGSLHYCRLAQDLNLFVDGEYITDGGHPAWTLIGEHWETMHPLCRWGGRFGDANHFSLEHEGRK